MHTALLSEFYPVVVGNQLMLLNSLKDLNRQKDEQIERLSDTVINEDQDSVDFVYL